MKNLINIKTLLTGALVASCFFSCKKDLSTTSGNPVAGNIGNSDNNAFSLTSNFNQVNIVADTMGFGAWVIDPNLGNAWGIAAPPNGPIWISDNHTGVSTIYNRATGATLRPPVTIPCAIMGNGGTYRGHIQQYDRLWRKQIHFCR